MIGSTNLKSLTIKRFKRFDQIGTFKDGELDVIKSFTELERLRFCNYYHELLNYLECFPKLKTLRCRLDALSEPLLKLPVTNPHLKNLTLKFEKSIEKSALYSIPFHPDLTLSITPLDYEDILVLKYLNPKLRVSTKRVDGQGLFKFKDALSYIYLKPLVIEEHNPFLKVYTLKGSKLQDQSPDVVKNFLQYYLKVMLTKS